MSTKRLIITVSHIDQIDGENVTTHFIPITNVYCKLHNVSFEHKIVKNNPDGRHISWIKIPILHKYIELYDEILFISNNSTIINQKINVFEFIKCAPEDKKWIRDVSIKPILYTLSDKSISGHPLSHIFLLDCRDKKATVDFLNDWWNLTAQHYKSNQPFEQQTLIEWKKDIKKSSLIRVADVWSIQEFDKDQVFITIAPLYKNIQLYEAKRVMCRMLQNKPTTKIGIYVRQSNYYASGAGQNCIFIKQSLEAAGFHVDLLIDFDTSKPTIVDPQIPYMYKSDKDIDYTQYSIIIFGSYIPLKEKIQQMKEKGIKTVMFHPMNSFDGIQNDHFIHNVKTSIPMFEENYKSIADEIWMVHNHEHSYKSLLEIQNDHTIPVRIIPLTWSPLFTLYNGVQYKYTHPTTTGTIDLIIMEPNSSYCKNAWMPLVIAESFYMKHKEKLNKVYLFGSLTNQASNMINNLSICKDSKLRKIGRMPINEIIKFFCNSTNKVAVISHNIQIPLNYAYYDMMNVGIPFVHNSEMLQTQEMGYFYDNVEEGLNRVEGIFNSHNSEKYNETIQSELAKINPYNETIVKGFKQLLESNNTIYTTIVTTQNKERLEFMKQQLKELQFPFNYSFHTAYTPDSSKDYLNVDTNDHGFTNKALKQLYQCGLRSHITALHDCLRFSSAEYFLILEDDVAFQTSCDLQSKILYYTEMFKKHPDIHYISLGYRPISHNLPLEFNLQIIEKKDNDLYWKLDTAKSPDIWGAQAYLIPRYYASKIVHLLHKHNIHNVIRNINALRTNYSSKGPQLIIDSILPITLKQAIIYPMLCIEKDFSHCISGTQTIMQYMDEYCRLTNIPYYKSPVAAESNISVRILTNWNIQKIQKMHQQFAQMKFPFAYKYCKYSSDIGESIGVSNDTLLKQSHIHALKECLENTTNEYFLIVDENVLFQVDVDLLQKINRIIDKLQIHELDYVSLSYLPPIASLNKLQNDNELYWGFDKDDTFCGEAHSYLISRKCAEKIVSKAGDVTLNRAILHPMLCIQNDSSNSDWNKYIESVNCKYFT